MSSSSLNLNPFSPPVPLGASLPLLICRGIGTPYPHLSELMYPETRSLEEVLWRANGPPGPKSPIWQCRQNIPFRNNLEAKFLGIQSCFFAFLCCLMPGITFFLLLKLLPCPQMGPDFTITWATLGGTPPVSHPLPHLWRMAFSAYLCQRVGGITDSAQCSPLDRYLIVTCVHPVKPQGHHRPWNQHHKGLNTCKPI